METAPTVAPPQVRDLGQQDYLATWSAMREYTDQREPHSDDQIWLCQHPPVFTQGRNGKPEHLLNPGHTPVIQSDRGGQITWHGPGQQIAYLLIDIKRRQLGPRALVSLIEAAIIELLSHYRIDAHARPDAPGVYVGDAKIAALGLRIRKGRSYHGLSLNLDCKLDAFSQINPCGYAHMPVTRLVDLNPRFQLETLKQQLLTALITRLQSS